MSKIGKKPINIPAGVSVAEAGREFLIKGPKGELSVPYLPYTKVKLEDNTITIELIKNFKQARSNWGTMRSLLDNAIKGVTAGFSKDLEINGVGFKASLEGRTLNLNLGFSHPIKFSLPDGIDVTVEKNQLKVSGFSKDLVGRTAAKIRSFKKPEPYKGKGIKYIDEVIIRKAGKKVGAT